ncbi:MAG: FtsX-like permease family protein [Gemmatimonadaceae bacterium]
MLAALTIPRLAWRNVLRNRRRSIITILSIAIGLAALTFLWGVIDGQNRAIIDNTTRYLAGDVQVHVMGYHDDPSLDRAIGDAAPVIGSIQRDPDVAAVAPRLEGQALASREDKSRGIRLIGVAPNDEQRVTDVLGAIAAGSTLRETDSSGVLIGVKLADALSLGVGDELVLVGQAYDGSIASARLPVRGIFRTKIDEYDGYVVLMPLPAVRDLLVAPGSATSVALRLKDREQLNAVTTRLRAILGAGYEVAGWPTLLPNAATSVRYHAVISAAVVLIFFVVIAAAVGNPVLMAVLERTREFGVMLAIGMTPARLLRLVLWEAILLGTVGVSFGNVVGLSVTGYFQRAGIDVSAFAAALSAMPGASDVLRPVVRGGRSVMVSALMFATALGVAMYPALKAAHLDPVNAIRGLAGRPGAWTHRTKTTRGRWPIFVRIAWRNVLRNPRRTAITAGGAAFAIFGYVFLYAYFDGFIGGIADTATRYLTGHIQIERAGFRRDFAPDLALSAPNGLVSRVQRLPHVVGAAPRVQAQAIASSSSKSMGVLFLGIDPVLERAVTFIDRTIVQGAALASGRDREINIGRKLAEKLNARLGEKIVIMTQAADGSLGTAAYRVSGIFATESASFDETMAFVTLRAAQDLLGLGARVSTINIRLDDRDALGTAMPEIRRASLGFAVVPWQELLPQVDEMVRYVGVIRTIIVGILLAVVAMAIMNTVFMSVAERTRELGMMIALGTRPAGVVRMVLYETAVIMSVASLVGYGVAVLVVAYFSRRGMDFSSFFRDYTTIPGITGITYPRLVIATVVWPGLALFVGSVVASVYPALKAARLDPATALRHT